jgi:hypothetical protein
MQELVQAQQFGALPADAMLAIAERVQSAGFAAA